MFVIGALFQIVGAFIGLYAVIVTGLGPENKIPYDASEVLLVGGLIGTALCMVGAMLEKASPVQAGGKLCV